MRLHQSRCRLLAVEYGTRLTGLCRMHSNISNVEHSRNPIKFNIVDAIKMYLNGPITSLQLKSLQIKSAMIMLKLSNDFQESKKSNNCVDCKRCTCMCSRFYTCNNC